MSYPQNPAADGDLVVGNLTSRTWNRFAVGADETVLMADSLTGVFDLRWSNELGVKTLRSDFTLTDNVGGTENLVIRVNAAGETSLLSSHASQTFWLGGHSAAGSLQFTQVSGLNTITPATTRGLTFAMDAARELIVKHGAGNSFVFNAGYNRSNRQFRQYDTSGASYGTLDADSSGRLYLGGAHAQKQTYIAGVAGSTSDGMLVRDDGDLWLHSTTNNKHFKFNVPTGGVYTWFHNFGQVMKLGSTSCNIDVPTTLLVRDAVLNNVTYGATFTHATTGGFPVAGFGAGATFLMQDSVLTYRTAAAWEVFWETAVAPVDSAINFRCITAGTYASPNLLYLSGKLQMIGVDTNAPTQKLDVNGGLRVRGLLDHDGTTVGFYGIAPTTRPTAYTQTYATATRTHSNPTALATFRAMGEIYITNNTTATTITTSGVWTQVQLTFTDGHLDSFDTPAAYELRYTGATTTAFHLGCTISLLAAGTNQSIRAVLVKNATVNASQEYTGGTILTGGTIRTKTGAFGDNISTAIHIMSSLATNDTLTLFVYNATSTSDITVIDCNMFGMGITQDLANDIANVKQVLNQVIDDLQLNGLLQ